MYDSRFVFCCRASVLVQFHCFGLHILIHFSSNLSVHIHIYVYMYIHIHIYIYIYNMEIRDLRVGYCW